MRYSFHSIFYALIIMILCFPLGPVKASALDINLSGSANLNLNNSNNNKFTTPLRNFDPLNLAPKQIELTPLATPPLTGTVNVNNGGWANTEVVDPDISNAKQAKEILRKAGTYVGKPPETIADDQIVQEADIQDFLANYYKYLKDEGLSSSIKTSLEKETTAPAELLANQQKLTAGKAASSNKGQKPNSP